MTKYALNLILAALILTACTIHPKTDLKRLYFMQADNPDQPPVVIIPGAMGSRLKDSVTGDEQWPGSLLATSTASFQSTTRFFCAQNTAS